MEQEKREKITIPALMNKKKSGEKITMLTAYDCPTAKIIDQAGIDTILVGDSLGNVILGYEDTVPVTMEDIIHHTAAVKRGVKYAFLIGDMPFMSYQVSPEQALENAGRIIKEGRAEAVKLEGGAPVAESIKKITRAGIPVCGHLGLTPQSATMLGGYRVQGKSAEGARILVNDAKRLEDAGVFMIIVECVPEVVGSMMSEAVNVPVVGIGAGTHTDGQVLVLHDMLGLGGGFAPKFVKRYASLAEAASAAVKNYVTEVKGGFFPGPEHTFQMDYKEEKKLK
jgi:3-methyl-2-oxobutanoate hydroxymethyltransferase